MSYIIPFTSDQHKPFSIGRVVRDVSDLYNISYHTIQIINVGDLTVQDEEGPLHKATRKGQAEAREQGGDEKALMAKYKQDALSTNLEECLKESAFNAEATGISLDEIDMLYLSGGFIEKIIDTVGNSDKPIAGDIDYTLKAKGRTGKTNLDYIEECSAIEQINEVKVIYADKSAVILIPYSTNKDKWLEYKEKVNDIAQDCKKRNVSFIAVAGHERLGGKRKAKMQLILDKILFRLAEINPQAKIYSVGGHLHYHEQPREYDVDGKKFTVIATGIDNNAAFYQIFDPKRGEFTERKVNLELSEEEKGSLELRIQQYLK